jgi:hypothetical protein
MNYIGRYELIPKFIIDKILILSFYIIIYLLYK